MGCDIHTYVEQFDDDGTWMVAEWPGADLTNFVSGPFDWRDYGMFGFLGYGGRNYSKVPGIAELRGLPADSSDKARVAHDEWGIDAHSASWLTVNELSAFDYTATFEDRRVTRGNDHGATAEPGGGRTRSFADFLGTHFFDDLATLAAMNAVKPTRVVFWFDN